MSKSKEPEVIYERIATLNKILAIPDGRFKSGYRERKTVGSTSYMFFKDIDGVTLSLSRVDKMGDKLEKTDAIANVTFPMESFRHSL